MPSKGLQKEAYVWVWLPGETEPVVAGRLIQERGVATFLYGQSYLARENAISIYDKELPLKAGLIDPFPGLHIAGAIRDAAPDAWGRRVILNRKFGKSVFSQTEDTLNEMTYLLESGSDRIGALDFQISPDKYVPRAHNNASLEELLTAAEKVDQGIPLTPELDSALYHGSSIGGARPKALIDDGDKKYIAKFSSTSDTYNVVKTEFVAMRLAKLAGVNAAHVDLKKASGKDVLVIERFDRVKIQRGFARKFLISALTLLELDEMMARYASYKDLADIIRARFESPKEALEEIFRRLVFNILVSNNDDHARNYAALWDGSRLTLSPAYDLCPQKRGGRESNQAMFIFESDKASRLEICLQASNHFLLKRKEALSIAEYLMVTIAENFSKVCDEGEMTEVDRSFLRQTQIFADYAFDGLSDEARNILRIKKDF
ncbi:MAG: type II toxin-antitoxin system HipA family toxin [Bdellovibrionaceae bacterium]|nr:type II toxin-antitoxin system HipA family toxin [Pseudobdellovibrionaceae bacterium]